MPKIIDPKSAVAGLKIELDETALVSPAQSQEIVDLHEALKKLATLDSGKAEVVELKYFGGFNYEEIAEVLTISPTTVRRDWEFATAWLYTNCAEITIGCNNVFGQDPPQA